MNPLLGALRKSGRSGAAVETAAANASATTTTPEGGKVKLTRPQVQKRVKKILERWPHHPETGSGSSINDTPTPSKGRGVPGNRIKKTETE